MKTKTIDIPRVYLKYFSKPSRYRVLYGGRGAGKSWACSRFLLARGFDKPIRILCTREIQRSISDSVHKLLCTQIDEMGLGGFYMITRDTIRGTNGTEIIFKGLRSNPQEIKSTEGVDLCWVEEAQAVSAESWDVLIPTIRKPNSEIWLTFNPLDEQDPTYQRFVLNAPDDALVRKVNYDENPYFPEVLRREMEWLKARDYESYLHIWEGEVRKHSNAVIFAGRFRVEEFETDRDARFYQGCDWGFACLDGDTVVPTDKGEKLLRDIVAGDKVLTREGYKRVIHAQSRGIKSVYGVDFGYKNGIIATGDHRIFTADGWKQVEDLGRTEKLCMMKSSLTARFIRGILTESTRIITTGSMDENASMKSCTEQYGNTITGKFPKVATYIMLTAIHLITVLKILFVSLKANIKKSITKINLAQFPPKKCKNIEQNTDTQKKTGQNAERNHLQRRRNDAGFALNVESLLSLLTCIKNSVLQTAANIRTQETVNANILANVAERFLLRLLTSLEKPVQRSAHINLQSRGEKEVFDITVENGEYFANGVLVHNCDPTVLVRCYLKDRTIFIDREAWGVGVDLDETPALFDTIETARSWPIKADNARPETISFMKRRGFHISGAKKWAGSIEDGIEYLKSLDIVIHPRCRHTIDEFNHYSYKVDKQTGDVLPVVVDAWNHCIDALRYSQDGLIKGRGQMQINPAALMMR